MKALQVTSPATFALLEIPTPAPGPGEVLMRVEAVTTCPQWDLHLRHNEPMFVGHRFHYPYTLGQPGHEATGEIATLGEGVTGLSVGERVSAWRDPGHHRQGCYAQYVLLDAANVIPVPRDLPPQALAPLELAMCVGSVFLMLREMNALRSRRVGVTGLGPAGLVAMQMARAEGAREVIGFDPLAPRREVALSLGLDAAYDPREELPQFPARPQAPALDTAIDCVGAKASVEYMMDRTEDVVALFGVQREDYTYAPRHYAGLRLCGYKGHHRAAAEYALGLVAQGKLDLARLVSVNLPLEAYGEGVNLLEARQAIKTCFWPWKSRAELEGGASGW
jgi:threonine dehydrogenase-like Zn-dependent dehydrogenase